MGLTQQSYPSPGASSWDETQTITEAMALGFLAVSLTNWDNTALPAIALGSWVEVNGSIFKAVSEEAISGTPTDAEINYIVVESDGTVSWTTVAPTWSAAKHGWYDGNDRYIGGCIYLSSGPVYMNKFLFDKGRDSVFRFEYDLGDWNMDSTASINVTHYLGDAWQNVKYAAVVIRDDTDSAYSNFGAHDLCTEPNSLQKILQITSTNIYIVRSGGGAFDNSNYDATSYNRGFAVLWVSVV